MSGITHWRGSTRRSSGSEKRLRRRNARGLKSGKRWKLFYGELEQLEVAFTPQRWNAIVEKVVVGVNGEMTFHFVNGGEVVV